MKRRAGLAVAVLVPALVITGAALVLTRHMPAASSGSHSKAHAAPRSSFKVCMARCRYVGAAFASPRDLRPFITATGVSPQIVEIYTRFGWSFPSRWAAAMAAQDRLPLIQVNPYHVRLAAIAAGRYDTYLARYGAAAKAFSRPVALSFGHEQNGSWYPWGCRHVSAATFIAADRRIVTVIRRTGERNVIWVWTANVQNRHPRCQITDRWPGAAYVTWVGLDGYLRTPGTTYSGVFGHTLSLAAKLGKPILLAETGVLIRTPGAARRIGEIYRGAGRSLDVIGVIYFDSRTLKFGDYRPQDNRAALAAFRRGVTGLQRPPLSR